jgi:hypothetical protein
VSIFLAWMIFPLVLLALCGGLGLLVDTLVGRRLPGAVVAPVGLAAIVVMGQFTTLLDSTAELTAPLLVVLALLGAASSLPWRFGRPDPWPAAVALAVFAVFAAPVVLSGHPTFAGYIKLDDTATWLALTDRVMEHGRDLSGLEPSSYRATLEANLPSGYPIGIFLPFGAAQRLVGGDLAWVFQPYLSFLAAMLSLCLWQICGGVLARPGLRGFAAFIAAQPALLYGYALWGGVKELGAAVFVALAAALAPAAVRYGATPRAAALFALPAGALVGVLSVGGLVWIAPMLVALALLAARGLGLREAGARALAFMLALAIFALPVFAGGSFSPFQSGLTNESELGNLIAPLDPLQALGVWPSGDFRLDPSASVATAVLVALALLAALLGLWSAWRRRSTSLLLFASALLAAAAILAIGSPWVDAKALATAAPAMLSLAAVGAVATLRLDRLSGAALATVLAAGVLWSNALAYGGADLAPYGQLAELQRIGEGFAGEGPALMTEFNPYGARHFLRELDGEGAAELRNRLVPLRDGGLAEKGEAVDTDELAIEGLLEFRTLVLRRSPVRSRPPLPYRLAWTGDYYEVWQRPAALVGFLPLLLPLGDESDPGAVPSCGEVSELRLLALQSRVPGVRLFAARHAPVFDATDGTLTVPRPGRYTAWLGGSVRGSVELLVDGHRLGEARHELSNDAGFIELGEAQLAAGAHEVELRLGGADLHPGSGGFPRPEVGPLLFAPAGGDPAGEIVSTPVAEASRLCGKRWDWIEVFLRSSD